MSDTKRERLRDRTHWVGCWQDPAHGECARERVRKLCRTLEEDALELIEELHAYCKPEWGWKYGERWRDEIAMIRAVLTKHEQLPTVEDHDALLKAFPSTAQYNIANRDRELIRRTLEYLWDGNFGHGEIGDLLNVANPGAIERLRRELEEGE